MSKSDPSASKRQRYKTARWVVLIFVITIFISGAISLISEEIMDGSNIITAFIILLAIVFVGIIFDVIGVAVTSADETPFHAMAAHKVSGAKEAISLLRQAERVSSICNDVIGDICGVVSGSASATIAVQILQNMEFTWPRIVSLVMSSVVAGLTVGGKAIGKSFAVNSSTAIVHFVGKIFYSINSIPTLFQKQKTK